MTRRGFLETTGAAAGLAILGCRKTDRPIAGAFVDDSSMLGHRLRDRDRFETPKQTQRIPVVVVGGGIAGLSAAWRLRKRGLSDFVVLEMEQQAGGTSRGGRNEISEFPWAAHYVPVPNRTARVERELFEELGLILPNGEWNPAHLCRAPEERLFIDGAWREGLQSLAEYAPEEFERFDDTIARLRDSGAFTVPRGDGQALADLDRLSMADWMRQQNFTSRHLTWYVDYACRDDYGSSPDQISAWAGVHYFACRDDDRDRVFTWPEGNHWIVKRLLERIGSQVRTGTPVYRLHVDGRQVRIFTEEILYVAEAAIFAAPTFLAPYLVEDIAPLDRRAWQYSPWLTANLVIDRPIASLGRVAWDNICFDSPTLGYVVANHQSGSSDGPMVWTFYWALATGTPEENRRLLASRDWTTWKEAILRDLETAHPDIRPSVARIDMLRLAHAMPRPVVGSVFDDGRRRLGERQGPVFFAHTDLSGFAIFEEAQHRGVVAADRALELIGRA